MSKNKKSKKDILQLNLTKEQIGEYGIALMEYLNNKQYAIDEITIHVTTSKNKHKKIKLIKKFEKWINKLFKIIKKEPQIAQNIKDYTENKDNIEGDSNG